MTGRRDLEASTAARRIFARRGERGVALPLVLIGCAALASTALAATAAFRASMRATRLFVQEIAVEELGRSGIDLAVATLAAQGDAGRLRGAAHIALGDSEITIAYVSERGRADINAAPAPLMEHIFAGAGLPPGEARQVAQAIASWRGDAPAQVSAPGARRVETQGKKRFGSLPELLLVPIVTPELFARIAPLLSPCAGQSINPLIADRAMLLSLFGEPAQADDYLARRGAQLIADGDTAKPFPASVRPYIASDGRGGDGIRIAISVRSSGLTRRFEAIACAPDSDAASLAAVSWQRLPGDS